MLNEPCPLFQPRCAAGGTGEQRAGLPAPRAPTPPTSAPGTCATSGLMRSDAPPPPFAPRHETAPADRNRNSPPTRMTSSRSAAPMSTLTWRTRVGTV